MDLQLLSSRRRWKSVRLHSAIGYTTPQNKLLGKEQAIVANRDQKLAKATGTNEKSNDKTNPPTP